MAEQRLTMDNVKVLYPPERYIHVMPSVSKHQLGPTMYGIDVATVKINPDDKNDVYPIEYEGYGDNRKVKVVCLTATAMNRIAGMADISIVPETVFESENLLVVRATAIMQTPGGAIRGRSSQVRWDRVLMREKIQLEAEEYVQNAIAKGWKAYKDLDEAGCTRAISFRFRKNFIYECEFGPRKAESKAARNATKHILAIGDRFDPNELRQKEFAVVKFVFAPDLSDPDTKRMVIEAGLRSQRALFGTSLALSTGSQYLPVDHGHAPRQITTSPDEISTCEEVVEDPTPHTEPENGDESGEADGDWLGTVLPMVRAITSRLDHLRAEGTTAEKLDRWNLMLNDAVLDEDTAAVTALSQELREATKKS